MSQQNMTIAALQQAYKDGTLTPKQVIKDALERCEHYLCLLYTSPSPRD